MYAENNANNNRITFNLFQLSIEIINLKAMMLRLVIIASICLAMIFCAEVGESFEKVRYMKQILWKLSMYVGFSAIIENGPVTQKLQIIEASTF